MRCLEQDSQDSLDYMMDKPAVNEIILLIPESDVLLRRMDCV
jgi:hypothetical protein